LSKETVRCAALYRVSTARQVLHRGDDEESLPLQRTAVRRFVEAHAGWKLVHEFSEEGVSAFKQSSADRDILQDVLRQAGTHEFDVLVLFKADRLSRQAMEYPFILATLHQANVRVFSVADDRELTVDGQYEKLLRFIEGWQAETESFNTSLRVSERMRQIAAQGRWTGGQPPYGYRFIPGHEPVPLVIEPAEAELIGRAFTLYLNENLGTPTIAAQLNAAGHRQRNGHLWSDAMLRRVMQNPVLTGRLAYGRSTQGRHGTKRKGAHDFDGVILSTPYEELVVISADQWEQAMDRMAHYNARRDKHVPRHSRADSGPLLFTGLARCAHCGGPLVSTKITTKKMTKAGPKKYWQPAYLCQNRATRGAVACDGQRTYAARRVETALVEALRATLHSLDSAAILDEARRQAEQLLWSTNHRHERVGRQLADAERVLAAWIERLNNHLAHPEAGLYSESLLATQIREHEQRVETLREELDALNSERHAVDVQRASLNEFLATAPDWWRAFMSAPRTRQKGLLKQVVERVTVGREGFSIDYRVTREVMAAAGQSLRWRETRTWQAG
jgi:site-specific DNA recombinase